MKQATRPNSKTFGVYTPNKRPNRCRATSGHEIGGEIGELCDRVRTPGEVGSGRWKARADSR